jgi:hypothetical protein
MRAIFLLFESVPLAWPEYAGEGIILARHPYQVIAAINCANKFCKMTRPSGYACGYRPRRTTEFDLARFSECRLDAAERGVPT